jgi:nucleoid-associated protein YgaU
MTVTSIPRIALPYLALVAAASAATVLGVTYVWRAPPAETRAANPVAMVSPAPSRPVETPAAPAAAASEASQVAAALAGAPTPDADPSVPSFDVARIERSGEAVIAGRAAPGATVELLRNGERIDRAVADAAGQFVMVPSRIPDGDSELTLRATRPDGSQVTSQQSVAVALAAEPNAAAARPAAAAAAPAGVAERVATARAVLDQAVASSQAIEPSDGGAPLADLTPKDPTKAAATKSTIVVSRGDSLWRISNLTYGDGVRYAVLYKANRDKIRNPNRIFPGQVFVLPGKEH